MSADRRRRGPRLIGPAIAALVRELARPAGEQTVELRLSAAAADAIARYGNSTVLFDQIIKHADRRLALLLAHRDQRAWWYGRKLLNSRPDRYGLISLNGTIVAPRPNRPWRTGR